MASSYKNFLVGKPPTYLSARAIEQRSRRYLREAEREFRATMRAAERGNRQSLRELKALQRALKRQSREVQSATRTAISRIRRRIKVRVRSVQSQGAKLNQQRAATPKTQLTPIERARLTVAILTAAERGKEVPANLERFLANQKPEIARQWINYYDFGIGDEPDDISFEDIESYYGQ